MAPMRHVDAAIREARRVLTREERTEGAVDPRRSAPVGSTVLTVTPDAAAALTDGGLMAVRLQAATGAASRMQEAGRILHAKGALVGDSDSRGMSPGVAGNDAEVAVGVLIQIAAQLLEASAEGLSGPRAYAGAALLRQVVEVEYLAWAFATQERDAAQWLRSNHAERKNWFSPAKLRKANPGGFLAGDYSHHCEQGGHPVPVGIPLLLNPVPATTQMLLMDLLLHSWRITDNLISWCKQRSDPPAMVLGNLRAAQAIFAVWGRADPLYAWSLTAPQPPPPGP